MGSKFLKSTITQCVLVEIVEQMTGRKGLSFKVQSAGKRTPRDLYQKIPNILNFLKTHVAGIKSYGDLCNGRPKIKIQVYSYAIKIFKERA